MTKKYSLENIKGKTVKIVSTEENIEIVTADELVNRITNIDYCIQNDENKLEQLKIQKAALEKDLASVNSALNK